MQFDPDPSMEPDAPTPENTHGFLQSELVESGIPVTLYKHSSGLEVRMLEISPDRVLFELPSLFDKKEFLFDRNRYDASAEEYLIAELEKRMDEACKPQDLSSASLSPEGSCRFPDLADNEVVQATRSLLSRIDTLLHKSLSPRERVVLQRFQRELEQSYDDDYGKTARRYITSNQEAELDGDSVYHSFIHYMSLEDVSSLFKKASVVPLYELHTPEAQHRVLEDLKRFQESPHTPKLFHDAFASKMAEYILLHPGEKEDPDPPRSQFGGGYTSGGGGFLFPDDDFID